MESLRSVLGDLTGYNRTKSGFPFVTERDEIVKPREYIYRCNPLTGGT